MVFGLVNIQKGWIKVRGEDGFIGYWQTLVWLFVEVGLVTFGWMFLSPPIVAFIYEYLEYLVGLNFFVVGTLSLWLVRAADCDITEDKKWPFHLLCYIIVALNVAALLLW